MQMSGWSVHRSSVKFSNSCQNDKLIIHFQNPTTASKLTTISYKTNTGVQLDPLIALTVFIRSVEQCARDSRSKSAFLRQIISNLHNVSFSTLHVITLVSWIEHIYFLIPIKHNPSIISSTEKSPLAWIPARDP